MKPNSKTVIKERLEEETKLACTLIKSTDEVDRKIQAREIFQNLAKRQQTQASRKEEFDGAYDAVLGDDGTCSVDDLMSYLGVSERTVQSRLKEFSDSYILKNKKVRRLK